MIESVSRSTVQMREYREALPSSEQAIPNLEKLDLDDCFGAEDVSPCQTGGEFEHLDKRIHSMIDVEQAAWREFGGQPVMRNVRYQLRCACSVFPEREPIN